MQAHGRIYLVKKNHIAIKTDKTGWKEGEKVLVVNHNVRTIIQNAWYWSTLRWAIDNGLNELGHYSPEAFHENCKAYFKVKTTTTLSKQEFSAWYDKVRALVIDLCGIDLNIAKEIYEGSVEE